MPENIENLILASGSPRRKQLLTEHGYQFSVIVPDESVEESISKDLDAKAFVKAASFAKARAVAETIDVGILLAADTIAVCDSQIIGKPVDRTDARRILELLQGRQHFVLTGVTVWNCETGLNVTHVESTRLMMNSIGSIELDHYLDSQQWQGKAGAFGYQDGLDWVQIENGLESNVVGLPVELIPELLGKVK